MPGWLLIAIGAVGVLIGLFALARPNSPMFASRRGGLFRGANHWQYMDDDSDERSPAGLVIMRIIGCVFVVCGIGLVVSGIGSI